MPTAERLLVTTRWHDVVLDARCLHPAPRLTMGRGARDHVRLPGAAFAGAPLARVEAGAWVVDALGSERALEPRAPLRLAVGALSLELERITAAPTPRGRRRASELLPVLLGVTAAFMLAIALVLGAAPAPLSPPAPVKVAALLKLESRPPPRPKRPPTARTDKPRGNERPGAPSAGPEGRAARARSPRTSARDVGLLAALATVTGPGSEVLRAPGLGESVETAARGLRPGAPGGDDEGTGNGSRGVGPGGGGESLSAGFGGGPGGAGPPGDVDLGGKRPGTTGPGERSRPVPCLSPAVAGRIIERARSAARFCYESRLTQNPNLAGKVVTRVTVSSSGRVREAAVIESTLGDRDVERCLERVVSRLIFPACQGGESEITYPWIFQRAGN